MEILEFWMFRCKMLEYIPWRASLSSILKGKIARLKKYIAGKYFAAIIRKVEKFCRLKYQTFFPRLGSEDNNC